MSSSCGSVCLLVLLGVAFACGSPVQFVSDNLKRTQESIADVLKLTQSDIVTNPLFSSVIRTINTSCQRREEVQLMNVTLDIYMQIFSSILQHSHNQHQDEAGTPALLDQLLGPEKTRVASALTVLQQKTERLKRHLSHLNHDREDVMSKLKKIEVDDPMVQRKALAQFAEIYQAASVIGSRRCGPAHSPSAE